MAMYRLLGADPNYQYQRQYGQGYVVPDNGQTVGVVRRSARRSARMQ
jgi:hypothetical protein